MSKELGAVGVVDIFVVGVEFLPWAVRVDEREEGREVCLMMGHGRFLKRGYGWAGLRASGESVGRR